MLNLTAIEMKTERNLLEPNFIRFLTTMENKTMLEGNTIQESIIEQKSLEPNFLKTLNNKGNKNLSLEIKEHY